MMRYQTPCDPPPAAPERVPGPGTGPALLAKPSAAEGGPDGERAALLARIAEAQVPSRAVVRLIFEVEGLAALSTEALRRAARILDVIEPPRNRLVSEGHALTNGLKALWINGLRVLSSDSPPGLFELRHLPSQRSL